MFLKHLHSAFLMTAHEWLVSLTFIWHKRRVPCVKGGGGGADSAGRVRCLKREGGGESGRVFPWRRWRRQERLHPSEGLWNGNQRRSRVPPRVRPMCATALRLLAVLCGLAAPGETHAASPSALPACNAAQPERTPKRTTEAFLMLAWCVHVIVKFVFFVFLF